MSPDWKNFGRILTQLFGKEGPPTKKTGRGYTKSAGKAKHRPYGKPYSPRSRYLHKKKARKRDR